MPAPHRPERPWEPEALRLPLEAPQRRTRRPTYSPDDTDVVREVDLEPDVDLEPVEPVERGERPGSHVIVIDIG